jgi:RNA polymerase sigma factor for flagellar operon FliA
MPPGVDVQDLEQDALLGLCESKKAWEVDRGSSFDAYAVVRMRGAMVDALRKDDSVSRLARTHLKMLAAAHERLAHRLGRKPRSTELAEEMGWTLEQVHACKQYAGSAAPQSLSAEDVLEDFVVADDTADPSQELAARQESERLARALEQLALHERAVLALHFEHGWMYWQIGKWLGVSASRAQQLGEEALARLRTILAPEPKTSSRPSRRPGTSKGSGARASAGAKKEPGQAGFEGSRKLRTREPPGAWRPPGSAPPR